MCNQPRCHRYGLSPGVVFRRRRVMGEGANRAVRADDKAVPVFAGLRLKDRVRELERLLGRNIMKVEILIKALKFCVHKKPTLPSHSSLLGDTRRGRLPPPGASRARMSSSVVTVRDLSVGRRSGLGISSSLALSIGFVDERRTYGIPDRRVPQAASSGAQERPRSMPSHLPADEGSMAACSNAIMARSCPLPRPSIAATAGVSGEMIREIVVQCIKKRFDAIRARRSGYMTTARSPPPRGPPRSLWRSTRRRGSP
jgi:hypothetical protein